MKTITYALAAILLVLPCTSNAISIDNFYVTSNQYNSVGLDIASVVNNDLGSSYRPADWNDIVSYYNQGGDLTWFRNNAQNAFVTVNGNSQWLYGRQYGIAYSDRPNNTPHDGYLAHDNVGQLYLGSWWYTGNILAYREDITPYPANSTPVTTGINPYTNNFITPAPPPRTSSTLGQLEMVVTSQNGTQSLQSLDTNVLSTTGDTYVIVNGWRPAEINYYEAAVGNIDNNPDDEYIAVRENIKEIAAKIKDNNPNANVLVYNWEYAASLGDNPTLPDSVDLPADLAKLLAQKYPGYVPTEILANNETWKVGLDVPNTDAPRQAEYLSQSLTNVLDVLNGLSANGYSGAVNLVGHSLGAGIVAQVAGDTAIANGFASSSYAANLSRLVLLDAPTNALSRFMDGDVQIEGYLSNVTSNLGSQVSIENYIAQDGSFNNFGSPSSNAANILVDTTHRWITDWFSTVTNGMSSSEYLSQTLSKGIMYQPTGSVTVSTNSRGNLPEVVGGTYVDRLQAGIDTISAMLGNKIVSSATALLTSDFIVQGLGYLDDAGAIFGFSQSPVLFYQNVFLPQDFAGLSFEYWGSNLSATDRLIVAFNDQILFSLLGSEILQDSWQFASFFANGTYGGSEGILTLGLLTEESGHQIGFRNIFFVEASDSNVPEPSTYALMLAGLALLGCMRSRDLPAI